MTTQTPPKRKNAAFLDTDAQDAHEHGERSPERPREDDLIGTSGSHTPAADDRPEEPSGEIAPSAAAEGGDDA